MRCASRDHAEKMLAQARRYASSARKLVSTDPDGAYVLAYDAARKALTAVLENQGLHPTSARRRLRSERAGPSPSTIVQDPC